MNEDRSTSLGAAVVHFLVEAVEAWTERRYEDADQWTSAAWALVGDGAFLDGPRCHDCPGHCGRCEQ